MLGKLISGVVGVFSATLLFWLGIAFEHRPDGWPNIPLHVGIFHMTFHLPDGPYVKLAALQSAFATEQQSVHTLQAALDRQNAAVTSLASSAQAWQRRSQQAVSEAASANRWRLATAAQIRRETLPADTAAAERCLASETLLRGAAR